MVFGKADAKRAFRLCRPGMYSVDVEAIWMFAIFAAKIVGPTGRVIAFEPETVAFGGFRPILN